MSNKVKYIVFPPEASTNWLFNDSILYNIWVRGIRIIMDKEDYKRYGRLARKKERYLDRQKYFYLTFLIRQGIIELYSFNQLYNVKHVDKNLMRFSESFSFKRYKKNTDLMIKGYYHYLDYIAAKECFIGKSSNSEYDIEVKSAKSHIWQLKNRDFSELNYQNYLKRMYSKLTAARDIAHKISKINSIPGSSIKIFDSKEYLVGQDLLENIGVKLKIDFPLNLYNKNTSFMKLKEICEQEKIFSGFGSKYISIPFNLINSIQFFSNKDIINRIEEELKVAEGKDIINQVKVIRNNREGKFYKHPKLKFVRSNLDLLIELIEPDPISKIKTVRDFVKIHNEFNHKQEMDDNYLYISQLICSFIKSQSFITESNEYNESMFWLNWMKELLRFKGETDQIWTVTQRTMQDWISNKYEPWYESGKKSYRVIQFL